ncbi:MAG: RidA family protein [Rickettsiales bacterium]|nr:RidA family protein [Rickettsiales bacterium]
MSAATAKIESLGITIPEAKSAPGAAYVPYTEHNGMVTISGQLPMQNGELQFVGKLGKDFSIEEGQECARICGLNILSQLRAACGGDLNKVKKTLRLGIFVHSTEDFTDAPAVANGVSNLFKEIFGDEVGAHARFAVNTAQLPFGVAVEVDGTFIIEN